MRWTFLLILASWGASFQLVSDVSTLGGERIANESQRARATLEQLSAPFDVRSHTPGA